jgi:predicted transcriptional regulator
MSKNGERRNFSDEILNFLLINPSGVSITDIAKGINTSRITASKYIGILEAKKKVTTKQIGAYTLYYSVQRGLIPKTVMLSFYTGLLTGLKEDITNKENYKKYGKTIADFMRFPYGSAISDEFLPKEGSTIDKYLKYLGAHISILDFIYEKKPKIKIELMEDNVLYTISDIELFDKSKDFDVHYYIASGVIEKIVSRRFPKGSCNVEEIDVEKRYVKISLKLNK